MRPLFYGIMLIDRLRAKQINEMWGLEML